LGLFSCTWDQLHRLGNKESDTAEIYAYRLAKQHCPKMPGVATSNGSSFDDEEEEQIAASLTNLVQHFCSRHDCIAIIECSGVAHNLTGQIRIFPQAGRGGSVPPFGHRAHVTINRA
jgi:hypothetical protein